MNQLVSLKMETTINRINYITDQSHRVTSIASSEINVLDGLPVSNLTSSGLFEDWKRLHDTSVNYLYL
jgi:hypothetical protein